MISLTPSALKDIVELEIILVNNVLDTVKLLIDVLSVKLILRPATALANDSDVNTPPSIMILLLSKLFTTFKFLEAVTLDSNIILS
jgi:hypothetical protein